MLYDTKKQHSLRSAACIYGHSDMDVCLHPLGCFVSLYANINFASTQSRF